MQCKLLNDKFNDQDTTASAVDLIKNMTGGTGIHKAGALKLGLREGFSFAHPVLLVGTTSVGTPFGASSVGTSSVGTSLFGAPSVGTSLVGTPLFGKKVKR